MPQKRREGRIKILRRIFGIKKRVEKKEVEKVIEPIDVAMRKFMETNSDGSKNWKPVNNKSWNPWNI